MKTDFSLYSYKREVFHFISHLYAAMQKSIYSAKQLSQLQHIMSNNKIATYYQPIINLQDKSCLGYEILNRPPVSHLFPTTEGFYEFIGETDQVFAFERFCRELSIARFSAANAQLSVRTEGVIFINVHPQVLSDANYRSGETINLLARYGLAPEQVVFELTEKQAVHDYVAFERILSNYRAQGFRIAIDDAGSGYNSLKAIVSLKPDFIKLDKALIRDIECHPEQQQIVKILKQFASDSRTHIIAEGIETDEEFQFLRHEGIEYGQGYRIGRPTTELRMATAPVL